MSFSKTFVASALAALACAGFVAATIIWMTPEQRPKPLRWQDVVAGSQATMPVNLFRNSGRDKKNEPQVPLDRSYDGMGDDGQRLATYGVFKDGSSRDVFYQDDGVGLALSREYFPRLDDASGRQMDKLLVYAADGSTVRSEARFRATDGSQEYDGHLLSDGSYQAFTLFGDGHTAETETLTVPGEYETNHAPKILRFQRWQEEGHVLRYADCLNEDGGSRDIKSYDRNGLLTLAKHVGIRGIVGTTVTAYFPGTTNFAMQSISASDKTDATFFRPDGSKSFQQSLVSDATSVTFFDETGTIPLFRQEWLTGFTDDQSKLQPRLWRVFELNQKGETTRQITFVNGVVERQEFFNLELKGTTYSIVTLDYDDAGKLRLSAVTPINLKSVVPPLDTLGLSDISTKVDEREIVPLDVQYKLPVPPSPPHNRDR